MGGKPPRAGRGHTSLPAQRGAQCGAQRTRETTACQAWSRAHSHLRAPAPPPRPRPQSPRPAPPRWGWRAGRSQRSGASSVAQSLCGWCSIHMQRWGGVSPEHSEAPNVPGLLQPSPRHVQEPQSGPNHRQAWGRWGGISESARPSARVSQRCCKVRPSRTSFSALGVLLNVIKAFMSSWALLNIYTHLQIYFQIYAHISKHIDIYPNVYTLYPNIYNYIPIYTHMSK